MGTMGELTPLAWCNVRLPMPCSQMHAQHHFQRCTRPRLAYRAHRGRGFGPMLGQPRPQGMSAWNAEGAKTLAHMP